MTTLQHPAPATFTPALLDKLAHQHATPLWVYDADTIRARVERLRQFDAVRFAQKACSNTHVLRLLRGLGVRVDAVSAGEIERALHAGYDARDEHSGIVFTADEIDRATLELVARHGIPVNAGSVAMIDQLGAALGDHATGHRVWLRINPGFGHGHSRKTNTGGEHSKHGIWPTDVPAALEAIARHGMRLVGLHMHIGSGVDYGHLEQVCDAMVQHVRVGAGLLREAHGVERAQALDAGADGLGVVDPQRRRVGGGQRLQAFGGEGGGGGVLERRHGAIVHRGCISVQCFDLSNAFTFDMVETCPTSRS